MLARLVRNHHLDYLSTSYVRSIASHLGIVGLLREDSSIQLPSSGRSSLWEVVEFRADGSVLETWKSPDSLKLHPRDAALFTHETISQKAAILARSSTILYKTHHVRAIIFSDRAILFPTERHKDTVKIAQQLKNTILQPSPLSFELKVLESLLASTATAFESRCRRLGMVSDTVIEDINKSFHNSAGELQRLIPITRKLTEMQHDVKETIDAIASIQDDDHALKALCLTERRQVIALGAASSLGSAGSASSRHLHTNPRLMSSHIQGNINHHQDGSEKRGGGGRPLSSSPPPPLPLHPHLIEGMHHTPAMRMASSILDSYELHLEGTHGVLTERIENIEQVRDVWHMQLDHQRNRVLRVNLLLSVFTSGGLVAGLPAAYFGMNLSNGMEDIPGLFPMVVELSMLAGVGVASIFYLYYRFGPKRRYQARLRDSRSLRDLLMFHLEDLDDILLAVKEQTKGGLMVISKKEFKNTVQAAVKGKPLSSEEIDLLYRVFDQNRDGFLEMSELVRLESTVDGQLEDLDNIR
jgi:magnesium transporter